MLPVDAAETIQRYRMFQRGQRVGVAVSGGADSVCLLHVLLELAPRWDLRLAVFHLNHKLRGAESDGDVQFVRNLAAGLGLDATVRSVEVAALPDNLEQAARLARLAFFREQLALGTVARIATGHTGNDQAETVLFRILRGAGGAGLAAIRPVTAEGIVRPLLSSSRDEIERYLRERGIPWREDSSNASRAFARNRIRHELLPQLAREWNPAIGETLRRTADWALAEEEYWDAEIARLAPGILSEREAEVLVRADDLCRLPLAVARRMVRRAVERTKGDLRGVDFAHIAAILHLASFRLGHGRAAAPGIEVERSLDWLRFTNSAASRPESGGYRLAAAVPGRVAIPGTVLTICLELIEKAETSEGFDSVYYNETGCLDWRALSGRLEVRNWRPGDQYRPQSLEYVSGGAGEVKIKSLFQKARIPRWERRYWPVVTDGSAIVWARRFGPAAQCAAAPGCKLWLRISESVTAQTTSKGLGRLEVS